MSRPLVYLLLGAALVTMLFPLYYLVAGSLSSSTLAPPGTDELLMRAPRWANFAEVWQVAHFPRAVLNSILVAVAVTLGNLVFALMTGYMLARSRTRSSRFWAATILAVMMMPAHVLIIPLFLEMRTFGWIDSYAGLIVPFLVNPVAVLLMRQYIAALPSELEDAARVDGAGEMYIVFRIVAPLCKPAMAVVAIQVFLVNWNVFLFPLIFTSRPEMRTLPVALAFFQGYQEIDWPHLLAASTLATLPILAVFLMFQRQIISGLTAGALKE